MDLTTLNFNQCSSGEWNNVGSGSALYVSRNMIARSMFSWWNPNNTADGVTMGIYDHSGALLGETASFTPSTAQVDSRPLLAPVPLLRGSLVYLAFRATSGIYWMQYGQAGGENWGFVLPNGAGLPPSVTPVISAAFTQWWLGVSEN